MVFDPWKYPETWEFDDYSERVLAELPLPRAFADADDHLLSYALFRRDHAIGGASLFHPLLRDLGRYGTAHDRLMEEFVAPSFASLFAEIAARDAVRFDDTGTDMLDADSLGQAFGRFKERMDQLLVDLDDPLQFPTFLRKALRRERVPYAEIEAAERVFQPGSTMYFIELFSALKDAQRLPETLTRLQAYDKEMATEIIERPCLMVDLWPHQALAFEDWCKHDRQGILEMATATGKTVIGLRAIEELSHGGSRGKRYKVRVMAHSRPILQQWRREVIEKLALPAAQIDGSLTPVHAGNVVIRFVTFQQVNHNQKTNPNAAGRCDLLIVDEVHHAASPRFREALPESKRRLGLSATVEGGERERILDSAIGKTVHTLDVQSAVGQGILPHFDWQLHPVPLEDSENAEYQAATTMIKNLFRRLQQDAGFIREFGEIHTLHDFVRVTEAARYRRKRLPEPAKQLQGALYQRRWIIHRSRPKAEAAIRLANSYLSAGRKTIVFAMDTETCDEIGRALAAEHGSVFVAHSKVKDPSGAIDAFRRSPSGVLIGARMMDEGIDIPDAEIAINVASSKTRLQLVQRLGRILRRPPGGRKKEPVFHHFIGEVGETLEQEDELLFLEDIAWANDLALRMGLDAPRVCAEPTATAKNQEVVEMKHKAEVVVRAAFQRGLGLHIPNYGVFRPAAVLQAMPDKVREHLTAALQERSDAPIQDGEWLELLRHAYKEAEEEAGLTADLRGAWWLLVMNGRDPGELVRLFESVERDSRVTGAAA